VIISVATLAGCSRQDALRCGGGTRYLAAESAGQLQIPDNLSVPDETASLRIPAEVTPRAAVDEDTERCLEESPAFSDSE
jgi:uncharacterized lipoprotein